MQSRLFVVEPVYVMKGLVVGGCKKCGYLNDTGVLFCHQCGQQQEQFSQQEIERRQHSSQCPNCDYYNPIEDESCSRCGYSIRGASGVMVRQRDGRVSLVRTVQLGSVAKGLAWLAFSSLLGVVMAMTVTAITDCGSMIRFFTDQRGASLLVFWVLLVLILVVEWQAGLLYRLKTVFVLVIILLAANLHLGTDSLRISTWKLDRLLLIALIGAICFCVLYLMRGRVVGDLVVVFMAFLGLYCGVSPIVTLFEGGGFRSSVLCMPIVFGTFPRFLGPTFLTYHLFFPYCFLVMLGNTIRRFLKSMEHVDGTKSIVRFINRRKEEARGELLNLFIVGVMLHLGFLVMEHMGEPSLVSLIQHGWALVF